jgi:hypothetical protein
MNASVIQDIMVAINEANISYEVPTDESEPIDPKSELGKLMAKIAASNERRDAERAKAEEK